MFCCICHREIGPLWDDGAISLVETSVKERERERIGQGEKGEKIGKELDKRHGAKIQTHVNFFRTVGLSSFYSANLLTVSF